jgi:hypothetical protein
VAGQLSFFVSALSACGQQWCSQQKDLGPPPAFTGEHIIERCAQAGVQDHPAQAA